MVTFRTATAKHPDYDCEIPSAGSDSAMWSLEVISPMLMRRISLNDSYIAKFEMGGDCKSRAGVLRNGRSREREREKNE